ncbi:MAG: GIY-YIG nuclease family protein [Patescibacteria group bacterium]
MKKENLLNLINDDDLGLLKIKPKSSSAINADDRLVVSFLEINNFVQENNREPEIGKDLKEHQLATRLKSLRADKKKIQALLDYDEYNLFEIGTKEIKKMADVFADDDLGILGNQEESLFNYKNIPKKNKLSAADSIAHRKPCRDFDKYENIFIECQEDLSAGKRKILKFTKDSQINEKTFFVLSGVLLFIDKLGEKYLNKYGRWDSRLRCIFENGTESNMLLRSLARSLYDDGYLVSTTSKADQINAIENNDVMTGFIYIVKSLSDNAKIKSLENLYKIGYSAIPVEERIKNAKDDPTYLFAPVKIITVFECYNLNPQKMELLLHNFFGSACLNMDVFNENNRRCIPREWFIAPLEIIEKAVRLIISGGIVNYKYDSKNQKITLK